MQLQIEVCGFQFTAQYEGAKAPNTVAAFRAHLLVAAHQMIHVGWSGQAGWIPLGDLDLGIAPENATAYPGAGQLILHQKGASQTEMLLSCGNVSFASRAGALFGNHFATITEGLENLPALDQKLQREGAQTIVFKEV